MLCKSPWADVSACGGREQELDGCSVQQSELRTSAFFCICISMFRLYPERFYHFYARALFS